MATASLSRQVASASSSEAAQLTSQAAAQAATAVVLPLGVTLRRIRALLQAGAVTVDKLTDGSPLTKYGIKVGDVVVALRASFGLDFSTWRMAQRELRDLVEHRQEREREASLLRHGIGEIAAVQPVPGEDEVLKSQATVLAHATDLLEAVGEAHAALAGGDEPSGGSVADLLGLAITIADIRIAQGRLSDAARMYEQGLALSHAQGVPALRGTADMHVGASLIARERDDLATILAQLPALRPERPGGERPGRPGEPARRDEEVAQVAAEAAGKEAERDTDQGCERRRDQRDDAVAGGGRRLAPLSFPELRPPRLTT